jgi:RNA polymerase sigma-70 factor (ECF subfamily)
MFKILFHVISHHRRKWLSRCILREPKTFEDATVYTPPVAQALTDEEVLSAFRKLPAQYADVVLLADVQEFSYKEIQEALGIPIGTVMSRLSRGRHLLRAELGNLQPSTKTRAAHAAVDRFLEPPQSSLSAM